MSAAPELILPPELAVAPGGEPFTDDDLDRWGEAVTGMAAMLGGSLTDAARSLALVGDEPHHGAVVLPEQVRGYRIEEDDHAEFCLRQLALEEATIAQLQLQADEYQARIRHWFDQESRRHAGRAAALEERLEDYGLRRREATGSATLTLPAGKIATTHTDPKAAVLDEEAVAAWADTVPDEVIATKLGSGDEPGERGQLVVRKPKVYVAAFRKLTTVQRIVVGVEVVATLECGHILTTRLMGDEPSGQAPTVERVPCGVCPPDPIEGDVLQTVVEVTTEPVYELQVVDLAGDVVPGTAVEPERVTAKVTARG